MRRLDNWDQRLTQWLTDNKDRPFKWGEWDCMIFAAQAIERVTGENVYVNIDQYTTEEEALEVFKKLAGDNTFPRYVDTVLGASNRCKLQESKRGDIVSFFHNNNWCMGVSMGSYFLALSPKGLRKLKLPCVCWHIE